ncbi:hypothetical protein BC939DRAFT_135038 [Gamsiella multidivaricata]|uniref:uncharacterized protein n=1 Tax=Gamsiella multidivaricata TaxID=101098 RepID=UPI00221F969F|nr:uncharacterized protein BC939DRAFT_135038 [Gamsiella multidivaricata]KAI7824794.1 hypothetical protein BC939DRAFT_135038 [Gamsiella multidivaricata]
METLKSPKNKRGGFNTNLSLLENGDIPLANWQPTLLVSGPHLHTSSSNRSIRETIHFCYKAGCSSFLLNRISSVSSFTSYRLCRIYGYMQLSLYENMCQASRASGTNSSSVNRQLSLEPAKRPGRSYIYSHMRQVDCRNCILKMRQPVLLSV